MRTLLVALLLAGLGVGGWFAYRRLLAPVEERACARVADRCSLDAQQRGACERVVREVASASGDDAADRFATCLDEARSCAEAAGCAAGIGTAVLSRSALDFLSGLRRSQ